MTRAVLIFGRTPSAEAASKNLVPGAAPLFEAVVTSWARSARECNAVVIVACEREHRSGFRQAAGRFIDQEGRRFGDRLLTSARTAFASGFDTVLITGIDAPPPAADEVREAFERIESGAVPAAIGPSPDGGINFVILRRDDVDLLGEFFPGDPHLANRCRSWFGPALAEFAPVSDIDSRETLLLAIAETAWRDYRSFVAIARPYWYAARLSWNPSPASRDVSLRAPPGV